MDCSGREDLEGQNKVMFDKGKVDHIEIFTLAQLKAWSWVTSKEILAMFTYAQWCIDPKFCLKSCGVGRYG